VSVSTVIYIYIPTLTQGRWKWVEFGGLHGERGSASL